MDLREQLQAALSSSFTVDSELDRGGMSRVFVAEDHELTRKVVIKVLSPELAEGLSAERFMREIRVAASLQQANIVPVLFAGSMERLPYYAMPFVDGESLRHRLASGALPVHEVIDILRDVSRALAYAHGHGVVHRDIKPDNVLISGGAAVVTDFGIAKAISAARTTAASPTLTQLGTSIGTPAYMSPEQAAGDPNVDHRADLYSLGCMAFELLAGRAVFAERTPQRVLAAHMAEAAPDVGTLRPDCPPALAGLVMRLLAKEPGARPQTAAEVLSVLDTVTSGPAVAMPATLIGGHRRLWPMLAGYAVAFAIVVVVTKAAIVVIGLPEWVVPGAVIVMALGLPALLGTAYVEGVARHVATATPTLTPGGTTTPTMPRGTMATMAVKVSPHVSWRRTIRGGYYSLGAFALVVAAFMTMRALGIGPARTLFAAGAIKADDKLLVSGFTFSPAADSALAPILTEGVANALGQSRAVRLLSPSDVAIVMRQMKRTGDIAMNDSLAREVAERAGASAIVSGKIVHSANAYTVSLALRRATDGEVLASFPQIASSPKELLEVVDALTRKLRSKMGESLRAVNRSVPLERATTSSLEALRRYSEGSRANDVDADFDRAVRALREAVAIDSTFALAWRKLGVALGNGKYPPSGTDSALDHAARFADRLPDLEKGLVLGAYYTNFDTKFDRTKGIVAYESAFAADSNSIVATNQLMIAYLLRRDYPRALRYARRELAISSIPSYAAFEALVLIKIGQAATGQALLDSCMRAGAKVDENVYFLRAQMASAFSRAKYDSIRVLAETMRRSSNGGIRLQGLIALTREAELRGQPARSARVRSELSAMRTAMGAAQPVDDSLFLATRDIWYRDDMKEGVRRLNAVVGLPAFVSMDVRRRPDLEVADLYARAGDVAAAKTLLARFGVLVPAAVQGRGFTSWHTVRGQIAIAEKRYGDAITEFRASDHDAFGAPDGCDECTQLNLARAFDAAKQSDSAIVSFERYLAIPSSQFLLFVLSEDVFYRAAAYKRLGELYDAKGDRVKAVAHYNAFVDLWKDADPDLLPAVAAVRRRLKEIAAREGT